MPEYLYSFFYGKANSGQLLSNATRQINAIDVSKYVMGDAAYPLLSWIMKPFTQPTVDTGQKWTYNYRICKGQYCIRDCYWMFNCTSKLFLCGFYNTAINSKSVSQLLTINHKLITCQTISVTHRFIEILSILPLAYCAIPSLNNSSYVLFMPLLA